MYRAFLPGLSLWRGSEAYVSSNFASQLLPPPSASVIQFGYFRGAGYEADASGLAAVGSFVFPAIGRFVLPIVALVLLIATGEVTGTVWLAGGLAIAISCIAGVACYLLLRGEHSARWLGAKLQRPLSRILVRLEREPVDDAAGKAVELRARALTIPARGIGTGHDWRGCEPRPHLPDPARVASLRRRHERGCHGGGGEPARRASP
jgi:hypothetical protein